MEITSLGFSVAGAADCLIVAFVSLLFKTGAAKVTLAVFVLFPTCYIEAFLVDYFLVDALASRSLQAWQVKS